MHDGINYDFAVARVWPDGSWDFTFSNDARVTTPIDLGNDFINDLLLQPDGKILAVGYASSGVNNNFALARYLPGLSVGTVDFSLDHHSVLIYPNPIRSEATLQYTLTQDETISIRLLDEQGRLLHSFLEGQQQTAGDYRQRIVLPETLPPGWYVLAISGERIVK